MLSNPTYGSWLNVLGDPKSRYIRSYWVRLCRRLLIY